KDAKANPTKVAFLTDMQLFQLAEAMLGDRRANLLTAPKLTMLNGQAGCVHVGDTETFVTGVKIETVKGQVVMVPENKSFESGTMIELCPTVSADRRFVNLQLKGQFSEKMGEVKLFPVTSMITPQSEGGSQGPPIPFTQFLQQPNYQTLTVNT